MAFDGITVYSIKKELDETLCGGFITKIAQPEKDELLLTVKNNGTQYRLLISANPSLPLLYLTDQNKQGPMTAPVFCMLLRKHIGSGRIAAIEQPSLERVLIFTLEHRNEMGDPCRKKLIVELMGKHSNIIFTDEDGTILDAIRRVSANVSSVREVLPGRSYFIPQTREKLDPLTVSDEAFEQKVFGAAMPLSKAIYTSFTGFSPMAGEEIAFRASVGGETFAPSCPAELRAHVAHVFRRFLEEIRSGDFHPAIFYENGRPAEFAVFESGVYAQNEQQAFSSVSALLRAYYAQKDAVTRIRQKSTDLRKLVSMYLERNVKKLQLQEKQLKDTEKREKFRIYGELLNTYGYGLTGGEDKLEALNYYTGEMITIPLDPTLSASQNAKRYFEKYNKQKRTFEAVTELIEETKGDIEHLESIQTALDIAENEADLSEISDELKEAGYIKKRAGGKGKNRANKAKPLHFVSSDGFHIYVGKNNYQNDALTFASPYNRDWWFHAKGIPGSHVVVKSDTQELPDAVFEEAARLAAYYSKGRDAAKVEIDYTIRKNVKKPNKAKPGFVIYYTNYSMMAAPDIAGIEQIS